MMLNSVLITICTILLKEFPVVRSFHPKNLGGCKKSKAFAKQPLPLEWMRVCLQDEWIKQLSGQRIIWLAAKRAVLGTDVCIHQLLKSVDDFQSQTTRMIKIRISRLCIIPPCFFICLLALMFNIHCKEGFAAHIKLNTNTKCFTHNEHH